MTTLGMLYESPPQAPRRLLRRIYVGADAGWPHPDIQITTNLSKPGAVVSLQVISGTWPDAYEVWRFKRHSRIVKHSCGLTNGLESG